MQTPHHHPRPAVFIAAFYVMMAVALALVCVFIALLNLSFSQRRSQPKDDPKKSTDKI